MGDEGAVLENGAAHPHVTAGEGEVAVAAASELRGDVLACGEVNELSGDVGRGEVAAYLIAAAVIQLVFHEAAVIGTGPGAEAFVAGGLVGAGAVVVVEAV